MSKTTISIFAALVLVAVGVAGIVRAQPMEQSSLVPTGGSITDRMSRDCVFTSGGWVIVDCSAAAAALSAQLNPWSRYVIQCGDDSYLAFGSAAAVADTSDGWLPYQSWLRFATTADDRYVSCRNKNSDSDCRLMECK